MANVVAMTAANMSQEPRTHSFSKQIGSSTYQVNVFFDGVKRETAEEKLLRCVQNDAQFAENSTQNVLQKGGSLSQRTIGQDVPPCENRCAILQTQSEPHDQSAGGLL